MPAARERNRFEGGHGGCAQTPQSCCSASVYTLTTPSCEWSHAHISSSELAGPSHDRSQSRSPANAHNVAYAPHLICAPKFVLSWILSKVQSETACCNKATRCRLWRSAERCEKQVQRLISPLHCYRFAFALLSNASPRFCGRTDQRNRIVNVPWALDLVR